MRWLRWLGFGVLGALAIAGAFGFFGYRWLDRQLAQPGPQDQPILVMIERGAGQDAIARRLAAAGAVRDARLVLVALWLSPWLEDDDRSLKAGEYQIAAGASIRDILDQLRDGRVFIRRLTVPEGETSRSILAALTAAEGLDGSLTRTPPEGSLLPETYHYTRGDRREALIERMTRAMDQALAEAWAARAPDLPLTSPRELLILASIVEKETGVAAERERVAAVYVNRLRRGMRLQADPTVAYGAAGGQGAELDRPLTRADLERDTPFNTYTRAGLPAGPIANLGRAALMAAARPAKTDELFFVADGTGGHAFAKTLEEHNRNVARWRDIQRSRGLR